MARGFSSGNLIQCADGANTFFDNKTIFTWTAWVYYHSDTTGDGKPRILVKGGTGVGKHLLVDNATVVGGSAVIKALSLSVNCATTDAVAISANNAVTVDTWVFVAATYDTADKIPHIYTAALGANIAEVSYASGYPITGVGSEGTLDASSELLIGARNTGGAGEWNGSIDDVRFYSGVKLSLAQLQAVMLKYPMNSSLIGRWPLGIASPDPDFSGNGNVGTLIGSPTVVNAPGISFMEHMRPQMVIVTDATPAAPTSVANSLAMMGVGV